MDKNYVNRKNTIFRVFLIILGSFLLLFYILPWKSLWFANMPFSGQDYKLWLDLQWWIELDYKIDFENVKKEEWDKFTSDREKEIIENLKKIIDKRVESLKINDSEINDSSYWNEKHIIVQIPLKWTSTEENLKNIDAAKKAIWNVVKVSFKELRNSEIKEDDLKARKEIAEKIISEIKNGEDFSILKNKYKLNFENVFSGSIFKNDENKLTPDEKYEIDSIFLKNNFLVWNEIYDNLKNILEKNSEISKKEILEKIQKNLLEVSKKREKFSASEWISEEEETIISWLINILKNNLNSDLKNIFKENKNLSSEKINEIKIWWEEIFLIYKNSSENIIDYILINKLPSNWIDIKSKDWKILNDKYLIKASVANDHIWQPTIVLNFNDEWAKIFYEATSRLVWRQIAIFVWWELVTAPNVNQPISWGQATITWRYTPRSAQKSADEINAWIVPAPIYLTSEKTIDSKIWSQALDKLLIAWVAWFILILIFLVIIYKASWFMAFLALVIYAIIVLAVVKSVWMVLTLASIAWLILSVWMAIDANILIFERIKWELREWKKLNEAIETWFRTSWSAIWDSNITWFLVAIILFIFGINLIKWFWAMLWIWIIVSLFTAMYVSRVFVLFLANNIKNKNLFIWFKDKK